MMKPAGKDQDALVPPVRAHLLVLVKNGTSLLPEFIAHHLHLFEKIHIIDHNSDYDLCKIQNEKLNSYRTNIVSYFQEEFTNVLLEKVLSEENPDWVFTLDVDEFLPFFSYDEFQKFLFLHKSFKVIEFSWRNGLPLDRLHSDPETGVSDSNQIMFYRKMSSTRKCAVNVQIIHDNFYIPRSNHRVQFRANLLSRMTSIRRTVPAFDTGMELYHIVSSSLDDFCQKITNFKSSRRQFLGVKGHGGSNILKYPEQYTIDEWLSYTANYRSRDSNQFSAHERGDFFFFDIFSRIDTDLVKSIRHTILNNPVESRKNIPDEEMKIIREKERYGMKRRLFDQLSINGNTISIRT